MPRTWNPWERMGSHVKSHRRTRGERERERGSHRWPGAPSELRRRLHLRGTGRRRRAGLAPLARAIALTILLLSAVGVFAPPLDAQDATQIVSSNPFAGFETHYLSNGVKVWFKHLPGVPNVSVSAGVPVGSDADPAGKEQLAHLTEHMLFSDHNGLTEQEIKDAVEGLGGRRNGVTFPDHTSYYVTIGKEHGLFAIEWLGGILSPHAMERSVMERAREPVQNEIGVKPRDFLGHLWAALNPPWLAKPGFWEREFGIERLRDPLPDRWRSLHGITPEELRGFYDRYYAPGAITVTIVGDLERDAALAVAERAFGAFPVRPVQRFDLTLRDPGRGRWLYPYWWDFQALAYPITLGTSVSYQSTHKLFHPSAEDLLTALFVRDLFRHRLIRRLRYGERKAVYGASVLLHMRGPAASLLLITRIDEEDLAFAKEVIAEEIEALRTGSLDPAEFEADRAAVVERLRGSNQTAESLALWTRSVFFDPEVFTDFPDLLSFHQNLTQSQVASFASAAFDDSRQVLNVARAQPVSQTIAIVAVMALIWLTVKIVARTLTTPVRMRDIRYVARFRLPMALRVAYAAGFLGTGVVAIRLAYAWIASEIIGWMVTIDSSAVQIAVQAALLVVGLVAILLLFAAAPRKVLVFHDHIRIKSRAWRSRILKAEEIAEISMRRFPEVWLTPKLLKGAPLAFGLARPGIHLQPVKGRGYFFQSRDTDELAEVLAEWRGRPVAEDSRE